jgi:hypothetical protein
MTPRDDSTVLAHGRSLPSVAARDSWTRDRQVVRGLP